MKIVIKKPDEKDIQSQNIKSWPIWEKEKSEFDWFYDSTEECLLLEGKVEVITGNGDKVTLEKGDFVTFPKGLSCKWKIIEPVRKHYNFKD